MGADSPQVFSEVPAEHPAQVAMAESVRIVRALRELVQRRSDGDDRLARAREEGEREVQATLARELHESGLYKIRSPEQWKSFWTKGAFWSAPFVLGAMVGLTNAAMTYLGVWAAVLAALALPRWFADERRRDRAQSAQAGAEQRRKELADRYRADVDKLRSSIDVDARAWVQSATDHRDRVDSFIESVREHPEPLPGAAFRQPMGFLHLGDAEVSAALAGVVPDAARIPVVVPLYPAQVVVFEAQEGRTSAAFEVACNKALQALATAPPGRARVVLIDPVSRGRDSAKLLSLRDCARGICDRVVSEEVEISEAVASTLRDVERVIQDRMKTRYSSVEDYNASAPVAPVPYRLVVALGFPEGFTGEAERNLLRLAQLGGATGCIVFVARLASRSHTGEAVREQLSRLDAAGQAFQALEAAAHPLAWKLNWSSRWESDVLRHVGVRHGSALAIADTPIVVFGDVAPPPKSRWKSRSLSTLEIRIGLDPVGDPVDLVLGRDTRHHVLVAGRSGSGKSNFLHVLVMNLCLSYAPTELELYLVDFKHGTEFNDYAEFQPPHVRAVALESEPELGLSVIDGLLAEIRRRSELFTAAGADGYVGYRSAVAKPLPRIVLLVDEFVGFFRGGSAAADAAAKRLEELAQQGRSFGVHLILSCQSLSKTDLSKGALAQFAIRIAFQMTEDDSALVLNDRNTAAAGLEGVGQCIYNDKNGEADANRMVQVALIRDEARKQLLAQISKSLPASPTPPFVFHGGRRTSLESHPEWRSTRGAYAAGRAAPLEIWLGDAMAMEPPVRAQLKRSSGANLLVVTADESSARALLANAFKSVASFRGTEVLLLDATPRDDPSVGALAAAARKTGLAPASADERGAAVLLKRLATELERRQASHRAGDPSRVLVVFGIHRMRSLYASDRYSERADESDTASARDSLVKLVEDGPAHGLHLIAWADSWRGAERVLEGGFGRHFALRVLVPPLPSGDVERIVEHGGAPQIRDGHALLYDDAAGKMRKFIPFRDG